MTEYHIWPGHPVAAEIKRIVREEIAAAAGALSGADKADRDVAIHEVRKSLKKIRGVLRLMEPELGEIFKLENSLFRDIGRQLAPMRDAGAIVEAFDELRKRRRSELDGRLMTRIRHRLQARKALGEKQANVAEVMGNVMVALERSAARVRAWPLSRDGFGAIAEGLDDTLRSGEKAMARAKKRGKPEDYHDWRKRVKEHWYHTRLLKNVWDSSFEGYEKRLKDLERTLGDDHNLVVLADTLAGASEVFGSNAEVRSVVKAIGDTREELSGRAFESGEEIYKEKSRHFTRRVRRLWNTWQKPPS